MPDTGMPRVLQPGYRLLVSISVAFLTFVLSSGTRIRLPGSSSHGISGFYSCWC